MDFLIAHVKGIIHQAPEPINLQFANVLITFQKKCDLVAAAHENITEADSGIYNQNRDQAELERYQAEFEELMSERNLKVEGQATKSGVHENITTEADSTMEDRATEATSQGDWETDGTTDWDYDIDGEYNSEDDQCGCYSAFGMDDDGEVRHFGMTCQYQT